jgi:hypothetical protein
VLAEAVAAGDLDALVRLVDGLCASRDWATVVELRDRCRQALERGLQLWPAAEYAEYRLALEAPGPFAGPVVETEAGRFALGPLWEVAASTHRWEELRDHLPDGPARTLCAHDRVLRAEDLTGDDTIDPHVLELPLRLQDWEPAYPIAVYKADEAEFAPPDPIHTSHATLDAAAAVIEDEMSVEALLDLGSVWARQSNGAAAAIAVEGDAAAAIAALGHGECRWAEVDARTALALVSWTAASGGAYGRRRGSAVGRFNAWWVVAALADLDWPAEPDAVGEAASRLRWWSWEPADFAAGWNGSMAIHDPESGLAWALEARDTYREGDEPVTS